MDKNKICEALYALPGGAIVRRRKSIVVPIVLLLIGAALIIANNLFGGELNNNLRSSLVFVGGILSIMGLVMTAARLLGGGGVPYHRDARCRLRYEEYYFDRKLSQDVLRYVNEGEAARLRSLEHTSVPAITVAMYTSPDGRFAAIQAFEYADLEYRPLSGLKIVGN